MAKPKRIEFTPPEGVVPEGVQKGETFDLVCSFRVEDDGMVCLVQMGDEKMPGYDGQEETGKSQHRPRYDQQAQGIVSAMSEGGMTGPGQED